MFYLIGEIRIWGAPYKLLGTTTLGRYMRPPSAVASPRKIGRHIGRPDAHNLRIGCIRGFELYVLKFHFRFGFFLFFGTCTGQAMRSGELVETAGGRLTYRMVIRDIPCLAVAAYNAIRFRADDSPESIPAAFSTKLSHTAPLGKYSEIQIGRQSPPQG